MLCSQSSAVVQAFLQGDKHTGSVQQEDVCRMGMLQHKCISPSKGFSPGSCRHPSSPASDPVQPGVQLYACFIGLTLAPPIPTIAAKHSMDSEPDAHASNARHQTNLDASRSAPKQLWNQTAAGGGLEDLCLECARCEQIMQASASL